MVNQLVFQAGEGKYRVTMLVTITDDGLIAQILGGEKPHVGAVAFSVPGPGVVNPEKTGCNTTVVPLLGHKDDEVAKPVAEELAKAWGSPVVVIVGVHVDNAGKEDVKELLNNCWEATGMLIRDLLVLK